MYLIKITFTMWWWFVPIYSSERYETNWLSLSDCQYMVDHLNALKQGTHVMSVTSNASCVSFEDKEKARE